MTGYRRADGHSRIPRRYVLSSEASAEFQKRILAMVCCSTASKGSRGNYNLELRDHEQSAVGCPSCNPRETSSTADNWGAAARKSLQQAISGLGEVRVHGEVYRVRACEIGIEAGGSQRGVPCQDRQAHDR